MNSAALGSLLGLHVSRQRLHHKYAVVGANERIETLLKVAGVTDLLVRYRNTREALKALGG